MPGETEAPVVAKIYPALLAGDIKPEQAVAVGATTQASPTLVTQQQAAMLRGAATGLKALLTPLLVSTLTGAVRAWASTPDRTGFNTMMGAMVFAAGPLLVQGFNRAIDSIESTIERPELATKAMTSAIETLSDPVGSLDGAFRSLMKNLSPYQIAKQGREMLTKIMTVGTIQFVNTFAGRILSAPLAASVRAIAPVLGATVGTAVDYSLHRLAPLFEVDPDTVPGVDKPYLLLRCIPTKVTARSESMNGTFCVTLEATGQVVSPVVARGTLDVAFADEGRIHAFPKLDGLTLLIGDIEFTKLVGSYSPAGLHITSATAVKKTGEKVVLGKLEISPLGWLSGELTIGGHTHKLGSEFDGGLSKASEPPARKEDSTPSAPVASSGGGGSGLVGHIQKQMSGNLGLVASEALLLIHYITDGKNGAAKDKDKAPEPENKAHSLAMKLFGAEPAGLLEKLSSVQLIPESMKNRVGVDITELRVGEEPSVTLGLDAWIRPFPKQAEPSGVEGLKLIWLVNKDPYVLLQASELIVDPNHGVFCGIEADPAGGLRIAAARIVLPGPDIPGLFSKDLVAIAEGIRIGETFDARTATAMINDLRIANALTVGQFSVSMKNLGEAHEFTAVVSDAKLDLPQVKASVPKAIVQWVGNGQELRAAGSAKLDAPVTVNDMLSIDSASLTFLIGKDVKYGTGKAAITLHVDRYTAQVEAEVVVDSEGICLVKLETGTLLDGDKQAVEIKGFTYERGKTLKIEHAKIAIPQEGLVRGEATASDKPAALVLDNLDFSALVRPKAQTPAKEAPEGPAKDAPAAEAPEVQRAWSIKGENLSKLLIGPAGHNILTIDFVTPPKTPRAADAQPGGLHALVTVNLGALSANADVDVYPAKEGLDRVTTTLGALEFGKVMTIQSASFDGARLGIKKAVVDVAALLGDAWPSALADLKTKLELDLDLDTKTGQLETLRIGGSASGQLFGKHLTLGEATAALLVSGAQLSKGPTIVSGGTLSGSLGIQNLVLKLFGANVEVTAGKLDVGKTVTGTFSGSGTIGKATVAVTGLQLLADHTVMLGSVKTTFKEPEGADGILKFLPPHSTSETPTDKPVTISLSGVGFNPTTGQIVFAHDEEVTAEGAAQAATPGPKLELENLGGIDIGDGAVQLQLEDKLTAEKVRGKNEAKVTAKAAVKIGPLIGELDGSAYIALGAGEPATDDKGAKVDTTRVRIEGSGKLGALEVKGAKVQRGRLSAESASIEVGALFDMIPDAVDAGFSKTKVEVTNIDVDLAKKQFSGGGAITLPELGLFGGRLKVAQPKLGLELKPATLSDSGGLVGINWRATLASGAITAKPVDALAVTAQKSTLVLGPNLIDGTLDDLALAWTLGATAKQVKIDNTGFRVTKAALTVDKSLIASLGIGDVLGKEAVPDWLVDADSFPLVVRLGELDFGYVNGKVDWPKLGALRFAVRKAGLKIGPAKGAFDLDAGTVTLGVQDKGSLKLTVPVPVAHGVGIEVGGGLDYDFSFATTAKAAKEADLIRVIADLEAKAKLAGVLYIGMFGGAPAVFSAAAGLYAGITLDAALQANAVGAMQLPTGQGKLGGGQLDLTFTFKDKAGMYPTLAGVAGAYASLHFLGTSRTIKKQLAKINLAQLHAHGAVSVRPDKPIELLPSRGEFPAYKFHIHEDLRKALFDDDFEEEFKRSQQRLDKNFAKVWAAEELMATKPAEAAGKSTPWKDETSELAQDETATKADLASAKLELEAVDKHDAASVDVLADLRAKLAKYRWHHTQLLKAEQEAKKPSMARTIVDAIRHPSFGIRTIKLVKGVPCIEGRVASSETDAAARVDDPTFPKLLGLLDKQADLTAADYEKKIELKEQEIAIIEARRATPALKQAEDKVAKASVANVKAQTKVELSKGTVKNAEEQLGKERDKLLESLYVASKLQTRSDDKKLKSASTIGQLTDEKAKATERRIALEKKAEGPARDARLAFWREHEKFLADEITFETVRVEAQHHVDARYADGLDPVQRKTLDAAAQEREGKRDEITRRVAEKIEKRRTEIEESLRALSARLDALAKKPSETQDDSMKRIEHAVELQKKQLAAYIDNIARLYALMGT